MSQVLPGQGQGGLLARRLRSWIAIARLLPLAGWPLAACSVAVSVLIGLLPVLFIVGTSVMLQRLAGWGTPAQASGWPQVRAALALSAAALLVQGLVSPLQAALGELLTRRIDGRCIRQLMRFGLEGAELALLERQDVLDRLALARRAMTERAQTPGAAAAGLIALVARYTQMAGAVVLMGVVLSPLAAVVLAAITALIRVCSRGSLTRWSQVLRGLLRSRRGAQYVLDSASDVRIAKEARALGIAPWLTQRAEADVRAHHAPLWRERRRIYFAPFLLLSAAALAGTVALLLQVRAGVMTGHLSLLGLGLAIQAILVPLRMGTYFPESDPSTMYGMLAFDTITELQAEAESEPAAQPEFAAASQAPSKASRQPLRVRGRPGSRARGATASPPDGHPADAAPAAELPRHGVSFDRVSFAYPGGPPVLSGLDLELPAGQSTAIVGPNGAGKTTLVKLLARLYQPTAGRVTADGTDIASIAAARWQRQIAVVFQDYVRYELDAAANIGLGAPARLGDVAALRSAARWAGIDDLISALPEGLATPLSTRQPGGVDLSGGQWQRMALARALFAVEAGARVLVLDEPTAHLDVRAEMAFFDRFVAVTGGLTSVIISHRFSTVRRATRIAVLSGGRITEAGSHDELHRRRRPVRPALPPAGPPVLAGRRGPHVNVLRAARFLLSLGMSVDRTRLIRAAALMLAGYVAAPLAAVALGAFTDDATAGRYAAMPPLAAAIAALLVAALMASHFAHLDYFELAEMQEARLRAELITLVNGPARIDYLDEPAFADNLSLVRESLFSNTRALEGVLQLAGLMVQTAITAAILVTLNPWLLFLPLTALPPALLARNAQAAFERAREKGAGQLRLSRHLLELATTAESVKELRIFGVSGELMARQESAWRTATAALWRGQLAGAAWRAAGQVIFAAGTGGAIYLLVRQVAQGRATIGDLILIIALAVQVSTQIAAALQVLSLLQSAGQTAVRIQALRSAGSRGSSGTRAVVSARPRGDAPADAPARLVHGITLDHLSFQYPHSGRTVLRDVCLDIPAGATLALVGENGAGKSTLVKLLLGMYAPTAGRILIDGADLAGIDPARWRAMTATLFQDFYRFEFTLREGIGLGQVDRLHDDAAIAAAVARARARRVVDAVPGGLRGYTGRGYADGTELSGGQWQTIGLARCLMRDRPRLLILDAPPPRSTRRPSTPCSSATLHPPPRPRGRPAESRS